MKLPRMLLVLCLSMAGVVLCAGSTCLYSIYPFTWCITGCGDDANDAGTPDGSGIGDEGLIPIETGGFTCNGVVYGGGTVELSGGVCNLDFTGLLPNCVSPVRARIYGPFGLDEKITLVPSRLWAQTEQLWCGSLLLTWFPFSSGRYVIVLRDSAGHAQAWLLIIRLVVIQVPVPVPADPPIASLAVIRLTPADGATFFTGETIFTSVKINGGVPPFHIQVFWADFADSAFVSSARNHQASHLAQVPVSPGDDDGYGVITWKVHDSLGTTANCQILYEVRNP